MTVRLRRDGRGGYQTPDGRFTVRPVVMGAGVTGWAGGRGWSNGRREWEVVDTSGASRLSQYGGSKATVPTLDAARWLIEGTARIETQLP